MTLVLIQNHLRVRPKELSLQGDLCPSPQSLDGNAQPWIEKAKYPGNTFTSIPDGLSRDAKEKRARYIERNVEIMQEFHLAHTDVNSELIAYTTVPSQALCCTISLSDTS